MAFSIFTSRKKNKEQVSTWLTVGRVWPGLGPWFPDVGLGCTGLFYSTVPLPRCCCCCCCWCWDWGAPSGGRRTHRSAAVREREEMLSSPCIKNISKIPTEVSCCSARCFFKEETDPAGDTEKSDMVIIQPSCQRSPIQLSEGNTGPLGCRAPYREKGPLMFSLE